jgi:hypothetical protein
LRGQAGAARRQSAANQPRKKWNCGGLPRRRYRKDTRAMEMIIRRFAGTFILVSLPLAHYDSPYWLWFTAFVGFNLLQSSFTNFCPLEIILKKLGVGNCCCSEEKTASSCCSK